ncbi:MAG: helix-turn-helix transcriptional regulator, partial [Xanthobacteraceae bacterium]
DGAEIDDLRKKFGGLSARQRQVMDLAANGLSSKEIARRLDISAKTVENHRAWVMERIGARNLAELVRIAIKIERGD